MRFGQFLASLPLERLVCHVLEDLRPGSTRAVSMQYLHTYTEMVFKLL